MKKYIPLKCELPHYYILNNLFLDFDDAMLFCDRWNIPYEFIIKTKYILDFKN